MNSITPKVRFKRVILFLLFSFTLILFSPFMGFQEGISIIDMLCDRGMSGDIFWRIRLPRVLMGCMAGAGLGSCGMVFQTLFRNPLASPYTLGVASGASFGAALLVFLGPESLNIPLMDVKYVRIVDKVAGGLLGAAVVSALIYLIASRVRPLARELFLLCGVAISFFFSSLILLLQYMSDYFESFQITRWLMGGLAVVDYDEVISLAFWVFPGVFIVLLFSRELDVIAIGEELAISKGVDVVQVRKILLLVLSLMTGAIVSYVGPIGFIGIVAPYIARLLIGPTHGILAVVVAVFSASFLVCCDTMGRSIFFPSEVPVGIITAIVGGPFFLWLLLKRSSSSCFLK